MSTYDEVMAKMRERLSRVSLPLLADTLAGVDAKRRLDAEHRMARTAVIDEICERCPQANAALDAWAGSDDTNIKNGSAAIVKAVRALR